MISDKPRLIVFHGGRYLDPNAPTLQEGVEVLIEGNRIKEVAAAPIRSATAERIHLRGRTLMPGLIDAHIHMFMSELNMSDLRGIPVTAAAAKAAVNLRGMLMRGFTSVRDMAGGDYGMRDAVAEGYIDGPRLFVSGKALSQTGGHGDHRARTDTGFACGCASGSDLFFVLADGASEVTKAVREQIRQGADQIKIMVNGGAGSPNDPLESLQYREHEIAAATEEAARWDKYVAAHAYTNDAILRSVKNGVRTVEHGNFIQRDGAELMREKGAFLVPTLITYEYNRQIPGRSAYTLQKIDEVRSVGLRSLEICQKAGVPIGYGTDMQMSGQHFQARGLSLHAEVMGSYEAIRSATVINAKILRREGLLGQLVPGAFADLLVVDGDPYGDIGVVQNEASLIAVMKDGRFYKNRLG